MNHEGRCLMDNKSEKMTKEQKKAAENANSLYRLGGIEILSIQQDEISNLWKIYLSTTEHYVVSREFDRSKGLYGNAPDDVIRQGLMDFSETIVGSQFSIWKVIDLFIDRCFDDSVFDGYTTGALWFSMTYPTYQETEDILSTYNCRLRWYDADSAIGELIHDGIFKTLSGNERRKQIVGLKEIFADESIKSIFLNDDVVSERLLSDEAFSDMPVFKGEFASNGEFRGFTYWRR